MKISDAASAVEMAGQAGRWLMDLRERMGAGDPDGLRSAGDSGANEILLDVLATRFPDDAVLSEEGHGEQGREGVSRLSASRVWIVDPLDGTREYGEGRTDWAVHVALWVEGSLAEGAVALPAIGHMLSSDVPPPVPVVSRRPVIAVSRTRPPAFIEAVAAKVDAELMPMGSVGAKVAAVVLGRADAYIHAGGCFEWDSAAPVAVARAAGLHASRIDGSLLTYNNADPNIMDQLVCRADLADTLLSAIAEYR